MVRKESNPQEDAWEKAQREPRRLSADPNELAELAPTEARRKAAQKLFANEERLEAKKDKALVRPGFRERVEEVVRAQWQEPVIVLRLGDTDPGFDIPGRRQDGTVKGKRLIRRFFWNIARGIGSAVLSLFFLFNGADARGSFGLFKREILVTGPENAMALDLLDRLRSVKGPWLACSPSRIAIVETGSTYLDPAQAPSPQIVWQKENPQAPAINFRKRTMKWPDGSSFKFPLHGRTEEQHLRKYLEYPDIIHWEGDWRSEV